MSHQTIFRLVLAAVFAGMIAISATYRGRASRAGGRVSRRGEGVALMIALRLFGLCAFGGAIAWTLEPRWMAWSTLALPDALRWVGAACSLAVLPLMWWVFHHLGLNVTDTVAVRARHTLVTTGPYRWVRHPLYSTLLVGLPGFALLTSSWFVALTGAIGGFLISLRTPIEEAKLVERHADQYRDYMRRTPRYVPRLRWPTPSAGSSHAPPLAIVATAIALAAFVVRPLAAQPLERFDTDRPDLTEGAEPVGRGVWQIEAGWGAGWGGGGHAHALGEGLLRIGLARAIEARLVLPSLEWEYPTAGRPAGLGNGGLGIKAGASAPSGRWAAGAIVQVLIPSGARARRAEAAEPAFVVAGETQLGEAWGLGSNLGLNFPRQNGATATDFFGTLTLGTDLSPGLALFVEYVGGRPLDTGGPWSHFVDGGASLAVARGLQLDASVGGTLPGDGEVSTQLGVSRRW